MLGKIANSCSYNLETVSFTKLICFIVALVKETKTKNLNQY